MHDDLAPGSGGKLNKRQASMTSNPLFIRVAESMVMRWPIFQVGWFSAWSTVIEENSDFGVFKKRSAGRGEPDALDLFHPSAAQALVDGVVFAVDGQQRLALAARFGGDQFSGGDQAFFVGQADGLARPSRLRRWLRVRPRPRWR